MILHIALLVISVFVEGKFCQITVADEENLKSPLLKITLFIVELTGYKIATINAPENTNCCQTHENVGSLCNPQCLVDVKLICGDDVAGSLGKIRLLKGSFKVQIKTQLNDSKCLAVDKNRISLINDQQIELLAFSLAGLQANQYLKDQVSKTGGNSITYSLGKMCHPYMGKACETACISYGPRYHCDFSTGKRMCRGIYKGEHCDGMDDPCLNNPCKNGGTCDLDSFGSPVCSCTAGNYGKYCEIAVCNKTNCIFGDCSPDGTCNCKSGYSGTQCAQEACLSNTCLNSGKCKVDENTAICDCLQNNAYDRRCGSSCKASCLENSLCTNMQGVSKCFCPFGRNGEQCITAIATTSCGSLKCQNNGECKEISSQEMYCECPPEYTGKLCDQPTCSLSNCVRGSCMEGGFCTCMESYTGANCDRPTCIAGKSCLNGGICVSSINGITCNCNNRFAGPKCQHECPEKCSKYGRCEIVHGQAVCVCDQYHTGSSCDINIEKTTCDNLDCKNGAQCRFVENKYQCVCTSQWTGIDCSISTCSDSDCQRGVCVDGVGCVCTSTFLGQNCTIASCTGNYCNNQGICNIYGNTQTCQCLRAFYGERCQYACNPRCVHGNCYNENGVSKCRCDEKFYGEACEHENIAEFVNMILLAVMVIVASIAILTFVTALLTNLVFKREKREKLFIKGTIQQGFEMSNKESKDLNWGSLA